MNVAKLYSVVDWDKLYESHESRKYETLQWFKRPNKHDGLGYRRMVEEKDACELFAAWNLILQVASLSEMGSRGVLIRKGVALTPKDLSLMTGFEERIFKRAFEYFSHPHVGWLVAEDQQIELALNPGTPGLNPATPGLNPGRIPPEQSRTEESRVDKRRGVEGRGALPPPPTPPTSASKLPDPEWIASLKASPAYRGIDIETELAKCQVWADVRGLKVSRRRFLAWLNKVERPVAAPKPEPRLPDNLR